MFMFGSQKDCKEPAPAKDAGKAPDPVPVEPAKARAVQLMKNQFRGSKAGRKISVNLVAKYTMAGASNTVYNTVQALTPIGAQDYSSFASLYDIVRVKGFTLRAALGVNQTSGMVSGAWGVAFDIANSGAYTSLADVMTATQMIVTATSSPGASPQVFTPDGFRHLNVRLPEQKERITSDGSAAGGVGGGWFATSATTLSVGWLKPYIEVLGSAVSANGVLYVTYHCEFAQRT